MTNTNEIMQYQRSTKILAEIKSWLSTLYVELKVEKANAASNALAKKCKTEDRLGNYSINRYFIHCKK